MAENEIGPLSAYDLDRLLKADLAALGFTTVVSKATVFNTLVTLNTDIFSSALSPTNVPCTFRIYACFAGAGVLTVRRTSGGVTVSEQINSGNALTANAAYIFDIVVDSRETLNLRYSLSTTAIKVSVIEIGAAA